MKTKELINEAVSLPVEERVFVVDSILRSLNQPETQIDNKWTVLARKRINEMRNGSVKVVPGERVFQKIWEKFGK